MNGSGRARPESGIELYAWVFMRLSGILLLVLALAHLYVMHVANNVAVMPKLDGFRKCRVPLPAATRNMRLEPIATAEAKATGSSLSFA